MGGADWREFSFLKIRVMTNLVRCLFSISDILVLSMCGDELKRTWPHLMSSCLVLIVIIVLCRLLSRKMKPMLRLFFNIMILFYISLYFFLGVRIGQFCSYLSGICVFLYLLFCDNESGEVVLPLPRLSSLSNSFIQAGSLHSETNHEGYFQTSSPAVSPQEDSKG